MRLVTKVNLALIGVVAFSAVINFSALRFVVMPSFAALEDQAADQNQGRVIEAIERQKEQVANSAGDYAIWDDTYGFMTGQEPEYEAKNVTAESLKTLGIDYFVALDNRGRIVLDKGFVYEGGEATQVTLFQADAVPLKSALLVSHDTIQVQSALLRASHGLVAVGYAPILRSDRSGERAGTLVLGRIVNEQSIKAATRVDFDLRPVGELLFNPTATSEMHLRRIDQLSGLDGAPVATLVSRTPREITAAGEQTILTTSALLLGSAILLLVALGAAFRGIAVKRIERLRYHLSEVALTGYLRILPEDGMKDEISETVQTFNLMARQLADLRDELRKQDYSHGAADQAAGLLHNVRNAMSPVVALAWQLSRPGEMDAPKYLAQAADKFKQRGLAADDEGKLSEVVSMLAARLMETETKRKEDLRSLVEMLRHIEAVLKEADLSAQFERVVEAVDIDKAVRDAVQLVARNHSVEVNLSSLKSISVAGHRVPLEQVISNVLLNAVEAIEESSVGSGCIDVSVESRSSEAGEAHCLLQIVDNGVGIAAESRDHLFERGFSTKPEGKRGLGLHWCANAIHAMGGKLSLESAGAGKGATALIVLPLHEPTMPQH